ncbi:hypothetical protein [uncultured Nocardioides sp.]|uniref:hypothetical protein n=1 Tax=uncultured Nocardioides sp. TaxID=198441 RepID=UPI002602B5BD|nr:hypothetical protein [uncultured Nocardioides sp.]
MTWLLRPGIGLARRDTDLLQVGLDRPHVAVLPDTRAVRRLLVELAHGSPLSTLDEVTAPALAELVRAGLVVAAEDEVARFEHRAAGRVHLEVPAALWPSALRLLGESRLRLTRDPATATVALVWSEGELARHRVDAWVRSGTPHLVVRETAAGPVVGPYVVPGATACLRCVDAHEGERDPRRALVVEQLAERGPLRPAAPDPADRALALAWAIRDLATAAEGGAPATWSATVALGSLPPAVTPYHRHLHCGCAWADIDQAAVG